MTTQPALSTVSCGHTYGLSHDRFRNNITLRKSDIVFQGTRIFCQRFRATIADRMVERMLDDSAICKRSIRNSCDVIPTDITLRIEQAGVARDRLAELISDYRIYLNQCGFVVWAEADDRLVAARAYSHSHNDWKDWKNAFETRSAESLGNLMLTICHQTRFLLGKLLEVRERERRILAHPEILFTRVCTMDRELNRLSHQFSHRTSWR